MDGLMNGGKGWMSNGGTLSTGGCTGTTALADRRMAATSPCAGGRVHRRGWRGPDRARAPRAEGSPRGHPPTAAGPHACLSGALPLPAARGRQRRAQGACAKGAGGGAADPAAPRQQVLSADWLSAPGAYRDWSLCDRPRPRGQSRSTVPIGQPIRKGCAMVTNGRLSAACGKPISVLRAAPDPAPTRRPRKHARRREAGRCGWGLAAAQPMGRAGSRRACSRFRFRFAPGAGSVRSPWSRPRRSSWPRRSW